MTREDRHAPPPERTLQKRKRVRENEGAVTLNYTSLAQPLEPCVVRYRELQDAGYVLATCNRLGSAVSKALTHTVSFPTLSFSTRTRMRCAAASHITQVCEFSALCSVHSAASVLLVRTAGHSAFAFTLILVGSNTTRDDMLSGNPRGPHEWEGTCTLHCVGCLADAPVLIYMSSLRLRRRF